MENFALNVQKMGKYYFLFDCNRVECRFNDATKLPKNFAMLKVLRRHKETNIVSYFIFRF